MRVCRRLYPASGREVKMGSKRLLLGALASKQPVDGTLGV
jgi:hypothetical protein